jgi:hypothetical protein
LRRLLLAAVTVKVVALVVGVVALVYGTGYLYDSVAATIHSGTATEASVLAIVATLGLVFSGAALTATLPESLRVRFRRPRRSEATRQVYGFGTVLAVGIGATLGSPLFILIPQNVVQYLFVSVVSLCLATVLSLLMARVYGNMYTGMNKRGLDAVGGPSFTRIATGTRSVRYFVSRISMWIANTALAAYSQIVFLIFDFSYFPGILSSLGVNGEISTVIVYAIAAALVVWTGLNLIFEKAFLRATGLIQIILASALVMILVAHSYLLGATGQWNLSGITDLSGISDWPLALLLNTAYLYLLFFGFQEIQSLEMDAVSSSSIPVVSWIKKGYKLPKARYLSLAMIATVVIASSVNILYALAVFAAHPNPEAVQAAQIPALYLAKLYFGPGQELLIAVAFLIATVTTFVPAFLAATRHFSALSDDGYVPHSLKNASWVFTVIAILFLAVGNQSFLVEITDFMVLISLGIISLSSVWFMKARTGSLGGDYLPLVVAASCFVAGGAVYLIDSSVVVFGAVAILFAYFIFDVLELGTFGVQLFLSIFSLSCVVLLALFRIAPIPGGTFLSFLSMTGSQAETLLLLLLLVAPLAMFANLYIDTKIFAPSMGSESGER